MQKAGGIVAIIAGVFGVFAAGITLMVGGLGTAFKSNGSGQVVTFGWWGLFFTFIVIVLGAMGISTDRKVVGVLLFLCALMGVFLGGTLVAIFMALAMVGGILIVIGAGRHSPRSSD